MATASSPAAIPPPAWRPQGPTLPYPSSLATTIRRWAAKPVYSSGEGGAMGMGGPLRSPCFTFINRAEQTNHSAGKAPEQHSQERPHYSMDQERTRHCRVGKDYRRTSSVQKEHRSSSHFRVSSSLVTGSRGVPHWEASLAAEQVTGICAAVLDQP